MKSWNHFPELSLQLLPQFLFISKPWSRELFYYLVDHTVWSTRNIPFCQLSILFSKTVKDCKGLEIALYLLANELACYTFMDILKTGISWVRDKTSLLLSAIAVAKMTVFTLFPQAPLPTEWSGGLYYRRRALSWGTWMFYNRQEACLLFALQWGDSIRAVANYSFVLEKDFTCVIQGVL